MITSVQEKSGVVTLFVSDRVALVLEQAIYAIRVAIIDGNYHPFFAKLDDMYNLKREGRYEVLDIATTLSRCLGGAARRTCLDYACDGIVKLATDVQVDEKQTGSEIRFLHGLITIECLKDLVLDPWDDVFTNQRIDKLLRVLRRIPKTKTFVKNLNNLEAVLKRSGHVVYFQSFGQVLQSFRLGLLKTFDCLGGGTPDFDEDVI